jgi:PAS domain S-box-containing protein
MAQKANMEAIFHSVADGILTLGTDLRVLNLNRAAQSLLAISDREAAGRPAEELLRGKLWDIAELLRQTVDSRMTARERENTIERRDGRELLVIITASCLIDRVGRVAGAVVIFRDLTHTRDLERRLESRASLHKITGASHAMQEIFALIEQVAPTDSTVLIQGESGTGKELVADAIHRSSARQGGPFVKVNCSALSEGLLESELFGHVKGAFTGAIDTRKGRFELADGGTIFLDEVGDLTERIQVKLLRVLQEREIERVGDTRVIKIDVRVLAATHQRLQELVEAGRFRQDLYYRLNVIPIHLPPLRERRADIPALAGTFLRELRERMGKRIERVSPDAMRALMDHDWPGNIRELRNAVEHAVVKARTEVLMLEDLPRELIETTTRLSALARDLSGRRPNAPAERPGPSPSGAQRRTIIEALEATGWNRGEAAARLGINRTTLWRRMQKLGIGA